MKTLRHEQILAAAVVVLLVFAFGDRIQASQEKKSDAAALRPFQVELCGVSGMNGCDDAVSEVSVPLVTSDGKPVLRLVIEYVSGYCDMNEDGIVRIVTLHTVVNGTTVAHTLIPVPAKPGVWEALFSHMTRLYADPGSVVGFAAGVLQASGRVCRVKLSGFLAIE